MYITLTASTAWNLDTPRLIQRCAPLTLEPRPGTNTSSSATTQPTRSRRSKRSTDLSSVRIIPNASSAPTPMKNTWRLRK